MIRKCIVALCIVLLLISIIFEVYVQMEVKEQMSETLEIPFIYGMRIIVAAPLFWICMGFLTATWLSKISKYGWIFLCSGLAIVIIYSVTWCVYQKMPELHRILYWTTRYPVFFVFPGVMLGIGTKATL